MDIPPLLLELYGRIPQLSRRALDGVDLEHLTEPPAPGANTIAWLIWHLTRVQDSHVADLLEADQLWVSGPYAATFGLEPDPKNTGYGHSAEEVLTIRPSSTKVLLEYLDAVYERSCSMIEGLTPTELDRIVDRRFDPPVSLGVRLVSIASDNVQHAGQAAYVRGMFGY